MRSSVSPIAGAVLLTFLFSGGLGAPPAAARAARTAPWSSAFAIPTGEGTLTFKADLEARAPIKGGKPGTPGRTWGYWGRLTSTDSYALSGSYRATCVWLANSAWAADPKKRDSRMSCTLVMSFRADSSPPGTPNGGSLVAQGLIRRPKHKDTLFKSGSARQLAIVGGTGRFLGRLGSVDLGGAPDNISVSLVA